jgi:hypothetical protein
MNAATGAQAEQIFARFLTLEQQARDAADTEQLAYSLVNDGQALFGFRHAALLLNGRVRAVTGISVVDPHAPFVAFVEQAQAQLSRAGQDREPAVVDAALLSEQSRADWRQLSAPHAFWLPLPDAQQRPFGGLWLAREHAWTPAEHTLLRQLGHCYAHAWLALQPRARHRRRRRPWLLAALAAALAAMLIPVRQSVLAPAEVIPLNGQVVAAPLDGVITDFLVAPNQPVAAGDLLLRFDDTGLQARVDVAERTLAVARAEYRASAQRAFSDAESGSRLELLAARTEQKQVELDYARDLLARSQVRAQRDGIAVFADPERWQGKPISTGEHLMVIADPAQARLRVDLAVGDAIALPGQAEVVLFPDSDPLNRHPAVLAHSAYEAQLTDAGQLAYRLDARFEGPPPRLGMRGTAKLYGDRVPLGLYLLRRPLAALRQAVGL